MLLRRVELVQFVLCLEFPEQQLYLPPTTVDRCEVSRAKLIPRQVRDVQIVVVGILVADADDAESFRIS